MTERTAFLRQETLSGRNKTARTVMPEADFSHIPEPLPVRKAMAFHWICRQMPVAIFPRELIVGTRTFLGHQVSEEDPEVDWSCPPLTVYPKYVSQEDIRRFGMDGSGVNDRHYTPDLGLLLEKGIGGICREAELRKRDSALRPDQTAFLDALIIAWSGMSELIRRYADLAAALSREAQTADEAERLEQIRRVCENIAQGRPTCFREAVQLLWFGHLGTILESGIFINYGRLDVILAPYLQNLPRDEARQLLECLLLKMYDQADILDKSYFKRHEGQLVVTLGGLLPNGESAISEVTLLFLDAIGATRLPEPEFNLRISSLDPPEYLEKASRLTATGCNFISYYNDDQIVRSLTEAGLSPEDARSYGFDLCQDITLPGKADFFCLYSTSLAHDLMALLEEEDSFPDFSSLMSRFRVIY